MANPVSFTATQEPETHSFKPLSNKSSGPASAVPQHSGMVRRAVIYLTFIGIVCLELGVRADDVPTKLSFDRYHRLIDQSPFAVATALIAPEATPNFAADLYIANAARSRDGVMVTIASTSDKEFKKYLTSKTLVDGYAIASIKWSKKVGKTTVTISKDGQLATLGFNQMLSVQPLPNKAPTVIQPPVPRPGVPQSGQRPGVLTPPTNGRAVIQRNPIQAPTPSPEE